MKLATISVRSALFCASVMLATTVSAQTNTIEYGKTRVALSSTFVSALGSLGLKAGVVGPTRLKNGVVDFPIVGGAIDLDTAKAQIIHSGGLTLSPASAPQDAQPTVVLESFIIDTTGPQPVLTGLVVVKGVLVGRVPLFNLQLPSGLTLPLKTQYGELVLDGVDVTLTSTAAQALNSVFGVTALQGGISIGTANVHVFTSNEECDWALDGRAKTAMSTAWAV
jgi:hypothetical protein